MMSPETKVTKVLLVSPLVIMFLWTMYGKTKQIVQKTSLHG